MAGGILRAVEEFMSKSPPKTKIGTRLRGVSRLRPHAELSHQATSNSGSDPTKILGRDREKLLERHDKEHIKVTVHSQSEGKTKIESKLPYGKFGERSMITMMMMMMIKRRLL